MSDEDSKVKLFDGLLCAYNVSSDTIRAWGETAQLDKTIEECAELIVALQHSRTRTLDTRSVASEIADVLVMVVCAARIVGVDVVSEEMGKKLVRLKGRLEAVKPQVDLEEKYTRAVQHASEVETKYKRELAANEELRLQLKKLQGSAPGSTDNTSKLDSFSDFPRGIEKKFSKKK
jgi:NTP pyrophosphatase (non-canonical NTP hydrolase)